MPCYHPITGYQRRPGDSLVFSDDGGSTVVEISCGRCMGCRLERSRQWAVRGYHESLMHFNNCFLTLTFDDDHLPADSSVRVRDVQLFLKRLRRETPKIRFMSCGEYGENFSRPHYHLIIFGFDFPDREFLKLSSSGSRLFWSAQLERLWPYGHSSIGDVTFESIAYVARYITKKIFGAAADHHYSVIGDGGEYLGSRSPEFFTMSRRPGIGAGWFERFGKSDTLNDYIVVRGVKQRIPKFYDSLLEDIDPEFEFRKFDRAEKAALSPDNTPVRLAVREQVLQSRLSIKSKRGYES